MATFVLVHGAWAGADGWHRVRRRLWEAGHPAFTPSLTGIGERSHLLSPQVDLSTHIQDVVNCVEYEDLRDIVLVGFSYGGMVVTGCVDLIGDRIAHMVYLDAFLPRDGESLVDLTGQQDAPTLPLRIGQDWYVSGPPRVYDDPEEAERAIPRRGDQPLASFLEAVRLVQPLEEYPFGRTYVKATADSVDGPLGAIWRCSERVRNHPAWRYRTIPTTHMVPNNRPDELVALLLEAGS